MKIEGMMTFTEGEGWKFTESKLSVKPPVSVIYAMIMAALRQRMRNKHGDSGIRSYPPVHQLSLIEQSAAFYERADKCYQEFLYKIAEIRKQQLATNCGDVQELTKAAPRPANPYSKPKLSDTNYLSQAMQDIVDRDPLNVHLALNENPELAEWLSTLNGPMADGDVHNDKTKRTEERVYAYNAYPHEHLYVSNDGITWYSLIDRAYPVSALLKAEYFKNTMPVFERCPFTHEDYLKTQQLTPYLDETVPRVFEPPSLARTLMTRVLERREWIHHIPYKYILLSEDGEKWEPLSQMVTSVPLDYVLTAKFCKLDPVCA